MIKNYLFCIAGLYFCLGASPLAAQTVQSQFINSYNQNMTAQGQGRDVGTIPEQVLINQGHSNCSALDGGISIFALMTVQTENIISVSNGNIELFRVFNAINLSVLGSALDNFCPQHSQKLSRYLGR